MSNGSKCSKIGTTGNTSSVVPDEESLARVNRISPSKRWCFTIFKFDESWKDVIGSVFHDEDKYCIGVEICPKTARKHLQGYVEFHKKCRPLNMMRNSFPGIHLEKCKGSRHQNIKYCCKDGDFVLKGFDLTQWSSDVKGIIAFWKSRERNLLSLYNDARLTAHEVFEVIVWRACFVNKEFEVPSNITTFRNNIEIAYYCCIGSHYPPGYDSEKRKWVDNCMLDDV